MALTRQEAADALVATGLDRQSLEAILQAVKSVSATGWGEIVLTIKNDQIDEWSANVMTIFRQIIGCIARIDKSGAVKVEYVAQDMGVDIVDMRLWLLLMEVMNVVALSVHYEYVVLNMPIIDWIGIDTREPK
jgi:hypothetical protein